MTYEDLREATRFAMREVARMGTWDGLCVDVHEGEPIIFAVIQRRPVHKFLLSVGIMKMPKLPERVGGIRCRVLVRLPARMR